MKKAVIVMIIIGLAWFIGFKIGVRHVMADAEIWLNEYVRPAEGDWVVNITVDGQTCPQVLWIY